ncbi:hypothetical protein [Roseibacillus ishigakijimensis]|uniref:Uncharacterized protein n=1 Tax=Roseibacillus ishigakijimensis TaxID=454146 RepID=A0A934VLS5_9BACT|nr:hypothetical protein [Roseibacillus ishigakijimensis]MBK1833552.1 hypothetical protein [Roseibacillus ishigakijimensis]
MTTEEIQDYIENAISVQLEGYMTESGEMRTSEGGDGRFLGQVRATRYSGLPGGKSLFLAIGETEKGVQIIKFGSTEVLTPDENDLNMVLQKELGLGKN